ncbi:retrovirus-related Pol polyprotein from transposon 17.6 [Trichonephila clavipes]|nr:retrovirus-related Pol polyprotein from transposon 17.6 [Trichonephila clavipes]
MRMDIELISDKPIKTKPYRMSPRQINILREEIKRLLELGVIEIGQSDYTSPLILVESPNKDPRPCVDYRRLNEINRAEFFPFAKYGRDSRKSECGSLCNGDGFVERLLSDSAHAESSEIRSFRYSIWHLYPQENDVRVSMCALLFLQIDGPSFRGVGAVCIAVHRRYSLFSQGWKDHDIVLGRLRKAGLKVKPSKLGYYSHYIPNYSTIASPLTDALKGKIKKEKITWDEKCGKAFEDLKAKLVTQPILFAPDFATDFILQTDASECCMKGILETGGMMGQCVQMWTRNYGALDQTARVCFGVLCANRKKEVVKRDVGPANKKERGACCEHTPDV